VTVDTEDWRLDGYRKTMKTGGTQMIANACMKALTLSKMVATMLLIWLWNAFKACLSAVLLLLAGFGAWGTWMQGALGPAAIAFIVFLFILACAPWVIPTLYLRGKAHTAAA
jgi:hypothetical protein